LWDGKRALGRRPNLRTGSRALGSSEPNLRARYMISLYAQDLWWLYVMGWDLPKGITEKDLFKMMELAWSQPEVKKNGR